MSTTTTLPTNFTTVRVVNFTLVNGHWHQDGVRSEVGEIIDELGENPRTGMADTVMVRLHTPDAPYQHGEVLALVRHDNFVIGCADAAKEPMAR